MKIFDVVSMRRPKRNKFNLSHDRKMSFNMGDLVPCLVQEILPGDSFRVNTETMIRFAPMIAPIMHRVDCTIHYFFVPNRLVWSEWEDFITGGREGTSTPVHPQIQMTQGMAEAGVFLPGTLWDFMGLPTFPTTQTFNVSPPTVSALIFRAFQTIYNEYYRDQNLEAPIDVQKTSGIVSGGQATILTTMRKRAWEKDYYTSALPWAQRGPEVLMPISGTGAVEYMPFSNVIDTATGNPVNTNQLLGTTAGQAGRLQHKDDVPTAGSNARVENIEEVTFDNASTTINEFRRAVRLQEWLEKNARGGARYIEQILSHFGVRSSDARLQRPEYLGGGKTPVQVSEVLSTFQANDGEIPQANMAGHGLSVGRSNTFKRSFEEHGYVIGVMSVLPRTAYQQGAPRSFFRFDKFDYFWPEFAHLGEQEIRNEEIYLDPNLPPTFNKGTFGYTPRYSEYKFSTSTVHGKMRDELAFWHMGRIFQSAPALNGGFVTSDPTTRIFAVGDDDPTVEHLYCQMHHNISALRPMPYFGTPTI